MPRTPKKWTREEDEILRKAVIEQNHGPHEDWHRIAACLPGRNNKDCRKRWYYRGNGIVRKGPWKLDEDHRLWTGVQKHGNRWAHVAQEVKTRNGDQCAKRWQDALDPNLDHSDWLEEEDGKLRKAVETYGRNWKTIVEAYFPRRSRLSVKNRYALLERKREIQDQISSFIPKSRGVEEPPPRSLPWGTPTSESISGASTSDLDLNAETADITSSARFMLTQNGDKAIEIDDCLLPDASTDDSAEFYPWSLSPAESGGILSPGSDTPSFAPPPPTRTESWATNLFDDITFLGNEDLSPELSIESTPEGPIFALSPRTCPGDPDEATVGTVANCTMSVDQAGNLELPNISSEGTQKYTISVESATFETIKSILEILLTTRTQVTIHTNS